MNEQARAGIKAQLVKALWEIEALEDYLRQLREKLRLATPDTFDSDALLELAEGVPDTFVLHHSLNDAYYLKYDAEYA